MERYVDIFVREHPRKGGEHIADYLERFMRWMGEEHGAELPDEASRHRALIAAQEKQLQALRAQVERYKKALDAIRDHPDHAMTAEAAYLMRNIADNAIKGGE